MKRVLIVEDDENFQKIYATQLEKFHAEIVPVMNAQDALASIRSRKPDVIVLDIMLPGKANGSTGKMNGFDFLEQIKKNPQTASIPVVMMTNLDTEEKVARDIGVNDYLVKANTTMQSFLDVMKKYLG